MLYPRRWSGLQNLLWMYLCLNPSMRAVDAVNYIYFPANPVAVNAKTILTLVTRSATWNEAAAICKAKYPKAAGTLAKVDSAEVAHALRNVISNVGENIWFGLYWKVETKKKGQLCWSDTSCTDFDASGYEQFGKKEKEHNPSKLCYAMEEDTGDWFQNSCNSKYFFVCEHMDFSASNCSSNSLPQFNTISATFYSVPKKVTSAELCTSECSGTLGCFLTWPGNSMCLMGIMDTSGSTFIRNRCLEITIDNSAAEYVPNELEVPGECESIDMNTISGVGATPISGNVPFGGNCPNNTMSQPVRSNSKPSTTTAVVQAWTTTVTSVQIITTTDVRATTANCIGATTTTTTTSNCIGATTTTTTTAPGAVTTVYGAAYRGTQTIVVPTTVTVVSVSIQPTTSTYTTYTSCTMQLSTMIYPCSSKTITKEAINYVTVTFTDYPVTSCATPPLISEATGNSGDTLTSATVNGQDPPTINKIDMPIYDNAIIEKTTLVNAETPIVVTASTDCALTTTVASAVTTTITRTVTLAVETVTAVMDCTMSSSIFNFVTIVETIAATPSCDIPAPSQVPDIVMASTDYVTMTATQILENPIFQTDAPCSCQRKDVNKSVFTNKSTEVQQSFVDDLKVHTSNLSSTRRRKESAQDDRITAKVPGLFAIALLISLFGLLVLLDLPIIFRGLWNKVPKKTVI